MTFTLSWVLPSDQNYPLAHTGLYRSGLRFRRRRYITPISLRFNRRTNFYFLDAFVQCILDRCEFWYCGVNCTWFNPLVLLAHDCLGSDRRSYKCVRIQARLGNLVSSYSISTADHYANNQLFLRVWQAYYGLMVCPWYAYSQTMISEVSPLPQM